MFVPSMKKEVERRQRDICGLKEGGKGGNIINQKRKCDERAADMEDRRGEVHTYLEKSFVVTMPTNNFCSPATSLLMHNRVRQ